MNPENDQVTPLVVLKDAIRGFVTSRHWEKYHNPKNLVMSIGVEVGELMEQFQWLSPSSSCQVTQASKRGQQVAEELADVMIYCILLAMALDIDLASTILAKIQKNASKYPVEEYRGVYHRPEDSNGK